MKTCLVLLVLAALATFTNGQFPPFIKVCKRNSKINECVKENILVAKKYAKQGIPKLFVQPTSPYKVTEVSVETPSLKVEVTKLVARGIDQFDVKDLHIDLENNRVQVKINFENIEAKAIYKFDGKLIGIQLNSQGAVYGNMTDLELNISLHGRRLERDGKTYINFDDRTVKVTFDECYAFFHDLFPNRELTEVTNRVFNDNIKEVVYELQPLIEETFAAIISESFVKLFAKYSIDELFPL